MFKKHSAVISAFGREFAKPGRVPAEMHRWLIAAQQSRLEADYEVSASLEKDEAAAHIERAERFLAEVGTFLEKAPENDE